MFRNYLAAALRNLARNRLYAAINIIGLAVGLVIALATVSVQSIITARAKPVTALRYE